MLHFRTINTQTNQVVDDTNKMHLGPFELRIGKGFAIKQWEDIVKDMTVGEVRKFMATDETLYQYPQLSRLLRKEDRRKHAEEHGETIEETPTHTCFHHITHDDGNADLLALEPGALQCELQLLRLV